MKTFRLYAILGACLALALWILLHRRERAALSESPGIAQTPGAPAVPAGSGHTQPAGITSLSPAAAVEPGTAHEKEAPAAGGAEHTPPSWVYGLFSASNDVEVLPREKLERWLRQDGTNAATLLAARQAGGGREFLQEALKQFPNDPQVLFAALTLDDSAEAKRERLDRFKAAAPDNSLPDYLSARNHLKNGQPEEAIRDLVAAVQKGQFQDYTVGAMQSAEELYLSAGKSPGEAKALGVSSAILPHLTELKGLASDMAALQREYIASGDTASAENLARYGLALAKQLGSGEGSHTLIGQFVSLAVERKVLEPLDPAKNYDFLGGTPQQRIARTQEERAALRELSSGFSSRVLQMNEGEIISYFERMKLYGEQNALEWLKARPGGQ